jgi:hypothetical protein
MLGLAGAAIQTPLARYFRTPEQVKAECLAYQRVLLQQYRFPATPAEDFPDSVRRPRRCGQDRGRVLFERPCARDQYARVEDEQPRCETHGSPEFYLTSAMRTVACQNYRRMRRYHPNDVGKVPAGNAATFPQSIQRLPICGNDRGPFRASRPCVESAYSFRNGLVICAVHGE